jgi:hypothetical protein
MRPSVPDVHITDARDAEFADYRSVAWQGIFGLIFALISPLAFLHAGFWSVPIIGVFFGFWAVRRIAKYPKELSGRFVAWLGLSLSLILGAAAPVQAITYSRLLANEAKQFSQIWIRCLTRDQQPQKAFMLTLSPQSRRPLDSDLWTYYRGNIEVRANLENYVNQPLIRTLLAMGSVATPRFYQADDIVEDEGRILVKLWYAVTYKTKDNESNTFFVAVMAERSRLPSGRYDWRIREAAQAKPEGSFN